MAKKTYFVFITIILAIVLTIGCANQNNQNTAHKSTPQIGDIVLTSTAFENGGKHTSSIYM